MIPIKKGSVLRATITPVNIFKTAAGALLSMSLIACGTAKPAPASSEIRTFSNITVDSGFDTVITLVEQTDDEAAFQSHYRLMCDSFSHYNALFDIYHDYEGFNNLKTVNDNAGIRPVAVDEELIELLDQALQFYSLSFGSFDVTLGPVLNIWHDARTEGIALNEAGKPGPLPSEASLFAAKAASSPEFLVIDHDLHTVFLTEKNARIDAGGIAKGFAAEKTARKLEEAGCTHAAVNAGGNNRTIGGKADGSTWNVGIQNPDGAGTILILHIDGTCSFVTSGDYERCYLAEDGRMYHHIIDPETCLPADRYRSVTIVTEDSAAADALSTALFTLPYEEGIKTLEEYTAQTGKPADAIFVMDPAKKIPAEHSAMTGSYYCVYTEGLKGKITWQ